MIFEHIQNTIRVALTPTELPVKTAASLAYSYIRFSTPEQAKGDSMRRQTDLRDRWCEAHGVRLDGTLTLRDEGVSGFTGEHRENPDRHGLACFLEAVRTGRVAKGSYLIVENLDRLSREDVVPAINLFTGILLSGVRIVQLTPHEQVFDAKADMMDIMRALLELSRGNSESRRKSGMLAAAWANKRRDAGSKILTNRLPGWVVNDDGKLRLDRERAAVVRRIFRLALEGNGMEKIAKRLNAEGVPTLAGRSRAWSVSTLYTILTSRAPIGQYQPHTRSGTGGKRLAAGEAIPGYYPRAVTDDLYWRVQQAIKDRFQGGGRTGKHVNIFQGLLRDARDGGSFTMMNAKQRTSVIVALNAKQGIPGAVWSTFPLPELERALVSALAEVKPEEVLPEAPQSKMLALAGELATVKARLARLKGLLRDTDEAEELVQTVRELSARSVQLTDELAAERMREAAPLAEAWAGVRPLAAAMDQQGWSDDARSRLKAAIRRVVEGVWLLVMPAVKGRDRWAAAQMWFKGSGHREYLIHYMPERASGSWRAAAALSVGALSPATAKKGGYDLRKPADAAALQIVIEQMPL